MQTAPWTTLHRFVTGLLGASALALACSSTASGTNTSGGCANDYSGRWNLSGSCTSTTCDVTQNACSLTARCDDGTQGSGTLTGVSATLGGLLGSGDTGSCTLTFSGKTFSMQCNSSRAVQPCSGSGSCESGSCGAPFPSGSSGTSGTSGTSGGTAVPCRQKAGADTDADCVDQAGKPRKLDCDPSDTATAVAAGCTPTKPGDSDVCCPLTVTGTPDGTSSGTSGTIDAGPPKVTCGSGNPALFAPIPSSGPACGGVRCAKGQVCCNDRSAATFTCASSCPAGTVSIACYNGAECAGLPGGSICCGKGAPDDGSCSYLVVRGYAGSVCSTACRTGEYRACSGDGDCAGATCTPAFLTTPSDTMTASFSVGVCR